MLRGQGFPGAKHWSKLCLHLSSHTFDFSILDQVSSPIPFWKRHALEIRVFVFSRILSVQICFPRWLHFTGKGTSLVIKNGNGRDLQKVPLLF